MAQTQQNIHVAAPGFAGLNTQDSPVGMPIEFAAIADNCVIDEFGRIASRKGFNVFTENRTVLNEQPIEASFIFQGDSGQEYFLCAGDLKLWLQKEDGILEELALPAGYPAITQNNWQFCQLNNECYLVQAGHQPLKWSEEASPGTFALALWTEEPSDLNSAVSTIGFPNVITSGYGRIFCGAFDSERSGITWSNLLDGDGYTNATDPNSDSGYFDLEEYWPSGYDTVVAIRVHNNFLIVWGRESMLIYNIPDTGPVDGTLADTVEGIGCAARDSVQPVGADVYFLDYTGVRLLSRTIQEKSLPIGDVSINVRDDIRKLIETTDPRNIRALYSPEDAFYIVFFPASGLFSQNYVFDTRVTLENGGQRPTRWPASPIRSGFRAINGKVWLTGIGGVYNYSGYTDVRKTGDADIDREFVAYPLRYQTHPQTWDQPVNLKFPKQVDVTVIGGQRFDLCLSWFFDYLNEPNTICQSIDRGFLWEYNEPETEYTVAEFTSSSSEISTEFYNVWGNGRNIRFQFDTDVSGASISFQEINVQALFGRTI